MSNETQNIIDTNPTRFAAIPVELNNYYPFGLPEAGRSWSYQGVIFEYQYNKYENYTYGYNGMQRDNSKGLGSGYTTLFREYDPEICRFTTLDPMKEKYPGISPFVAFANNPIMFIDPDGDVVAEIARRFFFGAGIDYITQVGKNAATDNTKTGLFDKTWNIMVKNVDFFDCVISGGESIIGGKIFQEGASFGVNLFKSTVLGASSEITKQYTGTQRNEDFLNFNMDGVAKTRTFELGLTVLGNAAGLTLGDIVYNSINNNSAKAKSLNEPIEKATNNFLNRGRKSQYTKLQVIQAAQKAIGSATGDAVANAAAATPKFIYDISKSMDRGGGR